MVRLGDRWETGKRPNVGCTTWPMDFGDESVQIDLALAAHFNIGFFVNTKKLDMKKGLLVLSGMVMAAGMLFAQPVNDFCDQAIELTIYDSEAEAILTPGTTEGVTDGLTDPIPMPCSANFFRDDVWYYCTAPDDVAALGYAVKVYYGGPGDMPDFGIAIYNSCDPGAENQPFFCSFDSPTNDQAVICLTPGQTVFIRVWSASGTAADWQDGWGSFRIAVFAQEDKSTDVVLWEETFSGGLNGWTTFGTCADAALNENAVWKWYANGVIDAGAYANPGVGITGGLSVCDGAVGVDSDYNDNLGIPDNFGAGPCPAPAQYFLVSPEINHQEWGVAGISITWTQGLREFQSTHFVSYRIMLGGVWQEWRNFEVNTEFPVNSGHFSADQQRVFLGGAHLGEMLQIRFVYNGNYYYWGIDDVRIIEAPCVNLRAMDNWYAIAPAVNTPVSQVTSWWPMNDVYNAGACAQTNVNLNFRVTDEGGKTVYNENLGYGTIEADVLVENVNFATPVSVSNTMPSVYTGTYTLTSDDSDPDNDFDFSDNVISFDFETTTNLYAYETGSTRSVAVAQGIYDATAPLSYTYGNYFYFVRGRSPNGGPITLSSVTWGVTNPADVAGIPINLILFKWVDSNNDQIAQSVERQIVAFAQVEFSPGAPPNQILETVLENFNNPGAPVEFEDNTAYLMMVEYNAIDRTFFFLEASEAYDYGGVVFSSAQAGQPTYCSVLGFSPDGNVQGIDYEVTNLGVTGRVHFGWDIVPVVRLNLDVPDAVDNSLSADNTITLFPNPASDQVQLKMEFAQRMDHVQIILIDAAGKSVFMQNYRDMEHAQLEFDVTRLVPGAYTMHIATSKGARAVPFIVHQR